MEDFKYQERAEELNREISMLPPGSITTKTINGKKYFYHRVQVEGKRREIYLQKEKVDALREQIEKRKALEKELKHLKKLLPPETFAGRRAANQRFGEAKYGESQSSDQTFVSESPVTYSAQHSFATNVRTGTQLVRFAKPVQSYKKRECYETLQQFVFGPQQDKVFILYGLRRTGKTTMIRQILLEMSQEDLEKTAFIQVTSKDTIFAINEDLKFLEQEGFRYLFIDEVTLMEDFIEGAALFSDIYAASGMKIVLSGTDSLGFVFTKDEQLYDRCILLHTTFIPYREFESVLGVQGINEYIRYGGTMSMGGVHYNNDDKSSFEASPFATRERADEYIDTAIARNIQHSLQYYQDGGHFSHLYELYEKDELTSAINRVVEDINHRFTKEVLTRTFTSGDLALSARNFLHDRTSPINLMQNIDQQGVNDLLKTMLDILDKEEQSVEIDEDHAAQIFEYLKLLDLIMTVDLVHLPNVNRKDEIIIVSQPGIRYAQADALVESLLQDEKFNALSVLERRTVLDRILSEIKGRMMEDIVLLETKLAKPDRQVFQLQFAVGEFDMVVHDPRALTCEIYEIKYSREAVPLQYRHLTDAEKCAETEHRFGTITGKYVIYRGEATKSGDVQYVNVMEYLRTL